jgi:hypothetical protein
MARALSTLLLTGIAALALSGQAQAGGGNYVFDGGTAKQRTQVKAALNASSFNWNLVPARITIHIDPRAQTTSSHGDIWLNARLLDAGRFSWAMVQDEYAHQVDFFLFDEPTRAKLNRLLGGKDWCYGLAGLKHSEYGCERFASTLVWAYWPSRDNAYRPDSRNAESAAMAPAQFRALMKQLVRA